MSRKVILAKNNIKVVQESLAGEASATPMTAEALRLSPTFCKRAADLPLSQGSLSEAYESVGESCLSQSWSDAPMSLWVVGGLTAGSLEAAMSEHEPWWPIMIHSLYLSSCGHPQTNPWLSQRFVETGLLTFWSQEKTEVYV